ARRSSSSLPQAPLRKAARWLSSSSSAFWQSFSICSQRFIKTVPSEEVRVTSDWCRLIPPSNLKGSCEEIEQRLERVPPFERGDDLKQSTFPIDPRIFSHLQ